MRVVHPPLGETVGSVARHTPGMAIPELGQLREVNVRLAWEYEALGFTPWLAENLDALSTALGIPMELQGQEVKVGSFSADILATDSQTGDGILIENQLEATDHTHLGQIMTYLAGLEVKVIVWIATEFRAPHLSAIQWLNDNTKDGFAFFAVQVSAVQIDDSKIAPMFAVVGKPNVWERELSEVARRTSGELSEIGQLRLAFWTGFLECFPDLEQGYAANAASSRWYAVDGTDIVVVLYKSVQGGGIFLRGPRNQSEEETLEHLAPYRESLVERLEISSAGNSGYSKWIHVDSNEPAYTVYAWLANELDRYRIAVADLVGSEASEFETPSRPTAS